MTRTDGRPSSEPRGFTTPDLMALIVGAAVASAVGRGATFHQYPMGIRGGAPSWFVAGDWLVDCLGLASLALVPVVVLRRARHGGMIRPVEFLAVVCGIWPLLDAFRSFSAFGDHAIGSRMNYPDHPPYWDWMKAEMTLGALAGVAFVIRRGRPRGLIDSFLLVASWVGLDHAMIFPSWWFNDWIRGSHWPPFGKQVAFSLLMVGLRLLVGWLPMAASLDDLFRRDRPAWTWVEWVGMTTVGSLVILGWIRDSTWTWLTGGGSPLVPFHAMNATAAIVSLAIAFLLARAARRAGFDSRVERLDELSRSGRSTTGETFSVRGLGRPGD